jgi:hypothetical protein
VFPRPVIGDWTKLPPWATPLLSKVGLTADGSCCHEAATCCRATALASLERLRFHKADLSDRPWRIPAVAAEVSGRKP